MNVVTVGDASAPGFGEGSQPSGRPPLDFRSLNFLYSVFPLGAYVKVTVPIPERLDEPPKWIRIPYTILVGAQAMYPQHLIPKVLRDASECGIGFSEDPLISHGGPESNRFRTFLYLEAHVERHRFGLHETDFLS